MLWRLLSSVFGRRADCSSVQIPAAPSQDAEFNRVMDVLDRAHERADMDGHREILYGGMKLGDEDMLGLIRRCLADSHTGIRPAKAIQRYEKSLTLGRYVLHTRDVPGRRAECGVFGGFVSLLACRLLSQSRPGWLGDGYHLVDSFEGLSKPTSLDGPGGVGAMAFGAGDMAAPIEYAKHAMREFPQAAFHRGWIPPVLTSLPEAAWAFVHIDVDLYEPTRACLEYFHPRLADGGVIICDDYGSLAFPGAAQAWDEYFLPRELPFIALSTGQSIYMHAMTSKSGAE